MQIVIDIPEEIKAVIDRNGTNEIVAETLWQAVMNGTLLPKGHGRLIDADKLKHAFIKWSMAVQGSFTDSDIASIVCNSPTIIEADKEQKDTYKYLLQGAESLVKDHPDLVRDIWNCSSCEHTEDECKYCYPELGYKNDKLKRDTEAVKEFVESDAFTKLMESLDEQDRAAKEDAEQFLRDIKEQEE